MNRISLLGIGGMLLACGCGGGKDLASLPPYPEAFQREWFDAQRDLAKGDAEQAYSLLSSCAMMEPEEPAIPFQMGKIDFEAERFSSALVHFNRSLQLDHKNTWAHHYRGLTLLALGNSNAAEKDILPLVSSRPGDIDYALEWVDHCTGYMAHQLGIAVCDAYEKSAAPDPEISHTRIGLLTHLGDDEAILTEVERLVVTFPDIVEFQTFQARLLTRKGQDLQALEVLQRAAIRDPYSGHVQFELGVWYMNHHNDRKAVEHLEQAFASGEVSLNEQVNILKHYRNFLYSPVASAPLRPLLAAALEANGGELALHQMAADLALADGDEWTAREHIKSATSMQPHRVDGWKRLVALDAVLKDWTNLAEDAQAGIERFPAEPELLLHAGIAANALGKQEEAIRWCEQARDYAVFNDRELDYRILLTMGAAQGAANLPREAAESFKALLDLEPANATLLNNYAWFLALAKTDLDQALDAIAKAVELDPGQSTFEDTYAWVLHVRGEHAAAAEWIEKAIASHGGGGSAGMWENAGDIYRDLGQNERARAAYLRAIERGADASKLQEKIDAAS